jgi:hypothetical protein
MPSNRNARQPSGENAKRLTWPFVFVNSRNAPPACACPLSAFQSSQQFDWYASCTTIARCRGTFVPSCGENSLSTPKEREYA